VETERWAQEPGWACAMRCTAKRRLEGPERERFDSHVIPSSSTMRGVAASLASRNTDFAQRGCDELCDTRHVCDFINATENNHRNGEIRGNAGCGGDLTRRRVERRDDTGYRSQRAILTECAHQNDSCVRPSRYRERDRFGFRG